MLGSCSDHAPESTSPRRHQAVCMTLPATSCTACLAAHSSEGLCRLPSVAPCPSTDLQAGDQHHVGKGAAEPGGRGVGQLAQPR